MSETNTGSYLYQLSIIDGTNLENSVTGQFLGAPGGPMTDEVFLALAAAVSSVTLPSGYSLVLNRTSGTSTQWNVDLSQAPPVFV